MRVLLVEDDKIIGDGVAASLDLEGFAVDWVEDVESSESALEANNYEMVILDIGLPDGSGLDVLKKIRSSRNNVPVLILTAYDDVSYKVKGLDSGADDYLIKPFKLDELKARLRALKRRSNGIAENILKVGDITLNTATRKVTRNGNVVNLGPKEYAILSILMEKKGKIVSKTQLENSLYGWGNEVESNTVEVHVHGIRKKLGRSLIQTIKFVGYRINEEE